MSILDRIRNAFWPEPVDPTDYRKAILGALQRGPKRNWDLSQILLGGVSWEDVASDDPPPYADELEKLIDEGLIECHRDMLGYQYRLRDSA